MAAIFVLVAIAAILTVVLISWISGHSKIGQQTWL